MASLHPGITGRADNQLEPLAVTPRQACVLLSVCNTRLYELIRDGELESYLDGRSRRITMHSIHRRRMRLLASASATRAADTPQPRRLGRKTRQVGGAKQAAAEPQEDDLGI
jgi:excisionase family DNA binding protein